MYCPQCGKQNPEDARFCGSCGAPLDEIRNNGDYLQMEEPSVWNDSNGGSGKEKDRNHKKMWMLVIPVVAVLAAAVPVAVILIRGELRQKENVSAEIGEGMSQEEMFPDQQNTPEAVREQDTSEEESSESQWTDLEEYAEQTLMSRLGSCELGPFTCNYVMEDGSLGQNAVDDQEGVIVYTVRDFDGDSQEELLAAVLEPEGTRQDMPGIPVNNVVLQMYEMSEGSVELTDEYQILNGVLGTADREDDWVFFRTSQEGIYILGSAWQFHGMYADGTYVSAAVLGYDGQQFVEYAADTGLGSEFSDVDVSSLTDKLEEIGGFDNTIRRMERDHMAYFDGGEDEDVFFSIYGENPWLDDQEAANKARNQFQKTGDPSCLGEKTVAVYPGQHPYGKTSQQENVSGEDPEELQGDASYYERLTLLEQKEQELEDSATDQVSMNRTSGEIYEMWDEELNYVYQQLKKTLTEDEFQLLKEEEIEWIEYRDQLADDAAQEWAGGSGMPMAVNTALSEATKARVYELANRWISGWRP